MRVLKFTLSGKTAFFKKPDVNTYFYFTYGNIHKVALLGMFGAILGYKGYGQMEKKQNYPEFYERLKDLKTAIAPLSPEGYIPKKIQRFNNSVGYASQEQGGNLIVKEQWLEDAAWDIYVCLEGKEAEKLAEAIVSDRCIYIPYLGKNDHPADISNSQILEGVPIVSNISNIDSLLPKNEVCIDLDDEDGEVERPFKYEEYLPVALEKETNLYRQQNFIYTNLIVTKALCEVVQVKGKNIVFF